MFEYVDKIKEWYDHLTPYIMTRPACRFISPYPDSFNWAQIFSPIEEQTWHAIRGFGQTPMYPQYPVDKYFLDFGHPKINVGIECDGKEWHTDKDKDNKRDKVLSDKGWSIYRISGADCYRLCEDYFELQSYNEFEEDEKRTILKEYYTTIEGLVKAIGIFYCDHKDYWLFELEIDIAFQCLLNYISPVQYEKTEEILIRKLERLNTEYYNWKEESQRSYR